jgi:DNA uptake protein ComE-like DNA-binding protein
VKYALVSLDSVKVDLISRPNEPDFSDVFALSDADYQKFIIQWLAQNPDLASNLISAHAKDALSITDVTDANVLDDINDVNDANDVGSKQDTADPNTYIIRGPYGPQWPCIVEPLEFEIGSAKVRVEIEDENAKYPLGWAMLDGEDIAREAQAGFETFCEWIGLKSDEVDSLRQEVEEVRNLKPFKMEFKPLSGAVAAAPAPTPANVRARRRADAAVVVRKPLSVAEQAARQYLDFSRLFHSSLVDVEALARPTVVSQTRKESALKYTGLWAASKVNINTAPRHVLEAALTFGGVSDAPKIAEEIIQRRRIKPFENIEDLRKSLLSYSASIQKCENFITTASSCFTIKVTAISGVARASAIAAVIKDSNKIKPITIISD